MIYTLQNLSLFVFFFLSFHLLILGLTIPQGKVAANLFTSCSAKCFVNVYVFGCSLSSDGCNSSNASSVNDVAKSITFSALSGAGYRISSHSTKYELTYALDTWTMDFKFFNSLHNCMTRRVPNKFVLTVGFKLSLKSSVAAEWITTFTLSMRMVRSDGEIPRRSSLTSPVIGMSFRKISVDADCRSVSNTWEE